MQTAFFCIIPRDTTFTHSTELLSTDSKRSINLSHKSESDFTRVSLNFIENTKIIGIVTRISSENPQVKIILLGISLE